jgi:hypothetical protein
VNQLLDFATTSYAKYGLIATNILLEANTLATTNRYKYLMSDGIYQLNSYVNDEIVFGSYIEKDMDNELYTDEFNPYDFQADYFPDMADFIEENIVAGDKEESDRLIASYWDDLGDDIFDDWGYFYLYDVAQGKYYFPLISPQNQDDGIMTTQTFNVFGITFTIIHGFPVQGIFKFEITASDNTFQFKFGAYGNMGSDGDEENSHLTHSYVKNGQNMTLYYSKQQEEGDEDEILYSYFIPKKISENNAITYDLYQEPGNDDNSLMSKIVTGGLSVYFAKTNDTKIWVANDVTFL